jgi:hypothetical protein
MPAIRPLECASEPPGPETPADASTPGIIGCRDCLASPQRAGGSKTIIEHNVAVRQQIVEPKTMP